MIVAHPWLALSLAGVPLLLLALQATHLDTSVPKGNWLPESAESVQALHTPGKDGSGRLCLFDTHDGRTSGGPPSRKPMRDGTLSIASASASRATLVAHASSRSPRLQTAIVPLSLTSPLRRSAHFSVVTDARRWLRCYPRARSPCAIKSTGRGELRKTGAEALTGVPGATLRIGGIPALNADYQMIVDEHLGSVTAMVVVGTLLALLAGFRSLFAAVKAIALNLLSVAASFGALVLVFQDGHGSSLFGVHGGTGSVFPLVPIVAFAIVFGLSMDYEVFLGSTRSRSQKERTERDGRNPGGDGQNRRTHYERRRHHDRGIRSIHLRKLPRGQDDRIHACDRRVD